MTELKKLKFRWTINDFDMCLQLPNVMMESPIFSIDTLKSTRFSLRIYPRANRHTKIRYVSLFLKRHQDDVPETICLKYEMALQIHLGLHIKKLSAEREFKKGSSWGNANFFQTNSVLKLLRNVLNTHNLTVECLLVPLHVGECLLVPLPVSECLLVPLSARECLLYPLNASECDDSNERDVYDKEICENLSMNMAEILKSGIHSDMCLVVQDEIFNVHRYILQCRCPKLMLYITPLPDCNKYSLSGIEANDFRSLLQYLYTGILDASSMTDGILAASRTYGLPDICNAFSFPFCKLAITEVKIMRQYFEWVIEDINKLKKTGELVYDSFCNEDGSIKIGISMSRNEIGSNHILLKIQNISKEYIAFFQCLITFREPQIKPAVTELKFTLEKEESLEINLISDTYVAENLDFPDTLNLIFEISVSNGELNSKIMMAGFQEDSVEGVTNLQLLQKDLKDLLNNATGSDVTLSVGGRKFKAHKAILCCSSKKFANLLKDDTKENQEANIHIKDTDENTVSSMLMHIYYGFIKFTNVSDAIKLYSAANIYDLLTLKKKCSSFLKSQNLSVGS